MYQPTESSRYASAAPLCSAFDSVGVTPGKEYASFAAASFSLEPDNSQFYSSKQKHVITL